MRPFLNKQKWESKIIYILQFLKKLKLFTKFVLETVCILNIQIHIYLRSFACRHHLQVFFTTGISHELLVHL